MNPTLILINPWIYDFAAYDLWSKPLGLLYLASYLRQCGFDIHLVDCLDVHHPSMRASSSIISPVRRAYGTGKFWRERVPKPDSLRDIPRTYSRYGLSQEVFMGELAKIRHPAAILVTSLMTYWYPGVKEVVRNVRKIHPRVPIILGGVYSRLCEDHARRVAGADEVIVDKDPVSLMKTLEHHGVVSPSAPPEPTRLLPPAFDLLRKTDYVCLLTSSGCPYRCGYCASHFLDPAFSQRDPLEVVDEIVFWHKRFGVCDFAFYDDALLVSSGAHIIIILDNLASLNLPLRFHTPNAVHAREITPEIAQLMHRTGFRTIRLGLETTDFSFRQDLDCKIAEGEFEQSIQHLLKAGFSNREIGAYVLIGLPGQSVASVIQTIEFVATAGALPFLSEYSPIPHTSLWVKALNSSQYDLASEPLFHNNTLLPCWNDRQKEDLPQLKNRVLEIRKKLR